MEFLDYEVWKIIYARTSGRSAFALAGARRLNFYSD
jgi:hypothetical protein